MPVNAVFPVPPSPDGFYATNNQLQMTGPKGFSELRSLENGDLFFRIDLPGVPRDGVRCSIDQSKGEVLIEAEAPKVHKHDSSGRRYVAARGSDCECCEIANVQTVMLDGVLRLTLSKRKIHGAAPDPEHQSPYCPEPAWTGRVLQPNPNVVQGPNMAYESKRLQNGGLYVRIDMPGVPEERFKVIVDSNAILVTGEAPAVGFDSSGRDYRGKVALLACSRKVQARRIKTVKKDGVIRLIIPPV